MVSGGGASGAEERQKGSIAESRSSTARMDWVVVAICEGKARRGERQRERRLNCTPSSSCWAMCICILSRATESQLEFVSPIFNGWRWRPSNLHTFPSMGTKAMKWYARSSLSVTFFFRRDEVLVVFFLFGFLRDFSHFSNSLSMWRSEFRTSIFLGWVVSYDVFETQEGGGGYLANELCMVRMNLFSLNVLPR